MLVRLWTVQARAICNLEQSFGHADPRALIQMATGSGKTFTAVNVAYRLLKFANAKRILFLMDRGNLGNQTEDEFANFEPPDDPRKVPDALHRPAAQTSTRPHRGWRRDERLERSGRAARVRSRSGH